MSEQDKFEPEAAFTPKSKSNRKLYTLFTVLSLLLVLLSAGGIYLWQHGQVKNLTSQKTSLSKSNSTLSKKENELIAKDANLTKALKQLQQVQNKSASNAANQDTSSNNSNASPTVSGQMAVTAVKNEPLTDFNAPNEPSLESGTDVTAVYVTITNKTSSIQSYDVFQFYATTNSGVVVDPEVYPGPYGAAIWNNSQIAPNGSQNIVLLFSTDNSYPTLSWTPPGGTSTVSANLPSPSGS